MNDNAASYEIVKYFLDSMKARIGLLGGFVIYEPRPKNIQFVVDMEWTKSKKRNEWLLKLEPEDYYEGPIPNGLSGQQPVWIFGKRIEGRLCYIKVFLIQTINVYCISFHFAEHDMFLPLKNVTEKI